MVLQIWICSKYKQIGEGGGITRIRYPPQTGASMPKPDIPNQYLYELWTTNIQLLVWSLHHIDIGNRLVPHAAFEPRAIFWTLRGKGIQNFVRKWRCDDHKGSIFDLTCWFLIVVKSRKRGSLHSTTSQWINPFFKRCICSSSPCRWIASMKDSFFFQSLCVSFQRSVFQAQIWDDAMRGILNGVPSLLRMLLVSFHRLWTTFFPFWLP
jgi:hypothetical protein